jgi:hypothetical protein
MHGRISCVGHFLCGSVYPSLIPTCWFSLVDVRDVILSNRRLINSCLLTQDVLYLFIPLSNSKKKKKDFLNSMQSYFHVISCSPRLNSCDSTVSEIVPLFPDVQAHLRKVFNERDTVVSKQILHINVDRFSPRLLTDSHQEGIAADLVGMLGPEELWTGHKRYQMIRTEK